MRGEPSTTHTVDVERAPRAIAARELARVTMQEHQGVPVAAIAGEVDISNVDKIAASLTSFSNLALGLVVDLRQVDYLDSAAISLLHNLAMRLRQRSQQLIVVCPPGSPPGHVLELTALTVQTPVLDELAPAIQAVLDTPDD